MPVAIVTGCAQSLGRAITLRLAEDGFDIGANDLANQADHLKTLADEIHAKGRKVTIVTGNVAVESDVQNLIVQVVKDLGSLDVMVANAGILVPKSIFDTTEGEWDRLMAVNVKGPFFCFKYAAKQMIAQGHGGRIIGASSAAGISTDPDMAAYGASKFAIRGLAHGAAKEWGKYGITVNCYAPGFIKTPMLNQLALRPEGIVDYTPWSSRTPLGTVGDYSDVAGMVSYLAGPDAKWVTGQTVSVNGGLMCT